MRQVPNYAIIGDGRVARHFSHYLDLLGIRYQQWSRRQDPSNTHFAAIIANSDRVLLLISDAAIEEFVLSQPLLQQKTLIHFSGQLVTPHAFSAHPLFPFSLQLNELATYEKIPFILEQEGPVFTELLPGLNNPHYKIPKTAKALYHSLCVISSNFTVILWQKFFRELEKTFQLPKTLAFPCLEQICKNLLHDESLALTGPLVRGDQKTIVANINALTNDPFQKVYQAFVEAYQTEKKT